MASCTNQSIEPDFEGYYLRFISEAEARQVTFEYEPSISFAKLAEGKSGKCTETFWGKKKVLIDPYQWRLLNENEKQFLIAHELGHCLLDREHDDSKLASGQCLSFMNTSSKENKICTMDIYSSNWLTYYLDELFTKDEADIGKEMGNDLPEFDSLIYSEPTVKNGYYSWGHLNLNNEIHQDSSFRLEIDYWNFPENLPILLCNLHGIAISYQRSFNSSEFTLSISQEERAMKKTYYQYPINLNPKEINVRITKTPEWIALSLNNKWIHTISSDQLPAKGVFSIHQLSAPFESEMRVYAHSSN